MALRYQLLTSERWEKMTPDQQRAVIASLATFGRAMLPRLRGETITKYVSDLRTESITDFQLQHGVNMALCWDHDRVVGASAFTPPQGGVIQHLYTTTLPSYERRGIGIHLLLMANSYARRKQVSMEVHFMSPEGRALGIKLINRGPRYMYKDGKRVAVAETYTVNPLEGSVEVMVHTNQPIPIPPAAARWIKRTKVGLRRYFRRKRGH